jgi:ubiquinone/menaquinone biosynthesis C-methylase UbiE
MIQSTITATRRLPAYAGLLAAYHRAQQPTLQRIIDRLPMNRRDRALDVPCGDGFYSRLLTRRCREVVGADLSDEFLSRARRRNRNAQTRGDARFTQASIYSLPFKPASFDLAWCAQSLITLHDPVRALREMHRVLRPGRFVAVLEHDQLHHVLLPWPGPLEMAVQHALHERAAAHRHSQAQYVARDLRRLMQRAGFCFIRRHTYATDHQTPLTPVERTYIDQYLRSLRNEVREFLPAEHLECFDGLTDPASPDYLATRPDFAMTCIDFVVVARTAMIAARRGRS